MHDEILGELEYEYGWTRDYVVTIFGQIHQIRLIISCFDDEEIEACQREAFARFEARNVELLALAETAIFNYYNEIVEDIRARVGVEFADKMAPRVTKIGDLASLVQPEALIVQEAFGQEKRIVGLLLTCVWDTSLGLAVKFVNEQIEDVGTQDIVL